MQDWQKLNLKIFNPFNNKEEIIHVEGILKDGQILKRAAQFSIMVEKHGIRDILFGHLRKLESEGVVTDIELFYNVFALDWMVYFNYKGKETLLMHPVMGSPSAECLVQQAYTIGCSHFVRLGTTGSLTTQIPLYSVISTVGAIRHDGTSDHYLPLGFPAMPDLDFQEKISTNLAKKVPVTSGISYTTETRFREDIGLLLKLNKDLEVLNIEMESASIFATGRALGMKTASLSMVSDCLASDEDTKHVEGTLKGVPQYQSYFEKGVPVLIHMFESILESFPNDSASNSRFNSVKSQLQSAKG